MWGSANVVFLVIFIPLALLALAFVIKMMVDDVKQKRAQRLEDIRAAERPPQPIRPPVYSYVPPPKLFPEDGKPSAPPLPTMPTLRTPSTPIPAPSMRPPATPRPLSATRPPPTPVRAPIRKKHSIEVIERYGSPESDTINPHAN